LQTNLHLLQIKNNKGVKMNMKILNMRIEEGLSVSNRVIDSLKKMGVNTISDLVKKEAPELLRYPGFGNVSYREVMTNLNDYNLHLGMTQYDLDKIEKKEQDASSSLPKFFKELNFELISKCEGAAKKSLEAIVEKKQWTRDEVEKYFDEHRKIMYSFETAMKGLF
jgi:hypothetical protein